MDIDSAMLAFGAETNASGLLHVFGGGFDSIEVGGLPGMMPPFWVIARIIADSVATEEWHVIEISGINPEGEPFKLTQEGGVKFSLKPAEIPGGNSKANLLTQVFMVVKHAGVYQFVLSVDGKELKRLLLHVKLTDEGKG